nr:MAG TPA: Large Terminase [Caudoviricetes sp.]
MKRISDYSKLKGKAVPRLWTRPLRELTPLTTFGFEAIKFAERDLGLSLHPWQKWFLLHSLELEPGYETGDPRPKLRYETVVLLVSRQNGKSFVLSARLLWRMFTWKNREKELLILSTAHKLSLAEEILDAAHRTVSISEMHDKIMQRSNTNGNKFFKLENGAKWKCEAASDDGGRGLTVTDLAFDELRQQRDWSAWAAMTNTTNAVWSAQTIAVSNAGEAKSEVLRSLRAKALEEMEARAAAEKHGEDYSPSDPSLGLFEWSAPDDCDIWDTDGWRQANPSLGYPDAITGDVLASKAALVGEPGAGLPEHKFRTENLCQWVNVTSDSLFSSEELEACLDPESMIAPDSPVYLSVDVSRDRKMASLSIAGFRDDGKPHVEFVTQRAFTEWVPDFLANGLAFKPAAVIMQGRGCAASSLIPFIEQAGTPVVRCEGGGLPNAYGLFYDRVMEKSVSWIEQETLIGALSEIRTKSTGDAFLFNREKSPVDIAPACAAAFALWGLLNSVAGAKKESAYNSGEMWYKQEEVEDEGGKWW